MTGSGEGRIWDGVTARRDVVKRKVELTVIAEMYYTIYFVMAQKSNTSREHHLYSDLGTKPYYFWRRGTSKAVICSCYIS